MSPSTAEPRPLAVVVDRWHWPGGGLEAYLQRVLPVLAEGGRWEPILLAVDATQHPPAGCLSQALRPSWLPRPWADRLLQRRLRRRLARIRPAVVWNLRHLAVAGAVHLPMGGYGPAVEAARPRSLSRRRRALLAMEQEALRQAVCLLPSSPKVARELAAALPQQAQELLPLPLLHPPRHLPAPWRPGEPLRVVACGRDAERHGARAAVQWWLAMVSAGYRGRFDLWGKSRRHLEQAIGEGAAALAVLGIHLHDWDGLFQPALEQAHVLFHPTCYDAFSLVCLEAACHGVPVVTTADAGVADLLPAAICRQHPASSAQSLVAAIGPWLEAWHQAAAEERESCRQQLLQRFSLDAHITQLEACFDRVMQAKMAH